MPTKGDSEPCLLDTSAALAFVQPSHAAHLTTFAALVDRPKGLAGHAAFETFSVLTRLPPPDRLTPQATQRLIEVNFPHTRFLSSERSAALVAQLAASGVSGGAVYDALVAAVAAEHGLRLVSRDARAAGTYRAMGADLELLP
ncbi:MAG: type II toxin-antitoxin system VapC family toxin [Phycicoccus sp.]|nr:type II toxin-antitoxin system VapC family toxin [Phycicoccus sp.]NMM34560.1 type II toxin-antitoxin system VapC family toxin [Phycicoccus sp.]